MEQINAYVDNLVLHVLQPKLLRHAKDLMDHVSSSLVVGGGGAADAAAAAAAAAGIAPDLFPQLPGSHLPLASPALEFVKFVCHVLALDGARRAPSSAGAVSLGSTSSSTAATADTGSAVAKVRANLLRVVGVKPFAPAARFANPCATYLVPDVICAYCNECRDLDICRDPDIILGIWACVCGEVSYAFFCDCLFALFHEVFFCCMQLYDKSAIEATLVQAALTRHVAYQVQDLNCLTCSKIKVRDLSLHLALRFRCS
jgi:DNA polymerase epsilon subunit 1